jgi:hypothetical protein
MLRISKANECLVVEGRVAGPYVDELARALGDAAGMNAIDVSGVGYVDAAGARLLRRLVKQGIAIRGSSAFVAETLKGASS